MCGVHGVFSMCGPAELVVSYCFDDVFEDRHAVCDFRSNPFCQATSVLSNLLYVWIKHKKQETQAEKQKRR